MTPNYAELLAANEKFQRISQVGDDECDIAAYDLAAQMALELDPSPITPELLAADGWARHPGSYKCDGSMMTHHLGGFWKFWIGGVPCHVNSMGAVRAMLRLAQQGE